MKHVGSRPGDLVSRREGSRSETALPVTVIRPSRPPISAEIAGLWQYRDLLWFLTWRDLKLRYRQTALGLLWVILQPLLTMLVLTIVFSSIFRFDVANYPVYALSGLLFWNFFQQGTVAAMNSLRGNAQLLTRLPVPRWIFPLATVLAGLVNLVLALVPLFVILVATGHPLRLSLLFLPISILLATTFTLGVALLVSPLAVFFADVVELIAVVQSDRDETRRSN